MKTFWIGLALLSVLTAGLLLGARFERNRPIPAADVQFDPESMSFVRR